VSQSHLLLGTQAAALTGDHAACAPLAAHDGQEQASLAGSDAKGGEAMSSLLDATDAAAHQVVAPTIAPVIEIPAIEAFAAAQDGHDVGGAKAATLGSIVAEVLHGGAGGGEIDALLAALPSHGGENAALDALASQSGETVPGWDMGPADHLSAAMMTNIVTDMTVFHHDAVQPAING
jgi:hypothetical protein